ncbi:O-antigen ligase family protein [Shewanella algae]|uniref:O-antigen ligase family protein n=1 Tax=Shewanella algae TaxID=38313 RepID=UPI0013DD9537|nr:O-antigen ligase family protein [Shewanella algae]MBO2594664.1 O-antigen ligase family protein [Shewanella algae]MBO2666020.1 O-antigen ligase family protein [Shewanella algae]
MSECSIMTRCFESLLLLGILLSSFGSVLSYHPPLGVIKDIINLFVLLISIYLLLSKNNRYSKKIISFFLIFLFYFLFHLVSYTSIENIIDGGRFHLIYIVSYVLIALRLDLVYGKGFYLIVKVMFYSGCLVTLIAVYEYFDPTIIEFMYGVPQTDIPNIKLPIGYRLISTMLNPINLGAYLCFFISVGYLLYIKAMINRFFFYFAICTALVVIFFTLSRLAFLTAIVLLSVIFILEFRRSFKFRLCAIPTICLAGFFLIPLIYSSFDDLRILERMLSSFDSNTLSENSRMENWSLALSNLDDILKIIWGLGIGVVRAGGDEDTLLAENTFVGIFIEFGLLGMALYLFFIFLLVMYNIKLKRIDLELYQFNMLFFFSFFALSLGNDMYTNYPFVLYFWFFSSYLVSFGLTKKE